MKKIFMFVLLGLFVVSVSAHAQEKAKPQKYYGYLSDVACGKAGKDSDGTDLTVHPEKHTVKCMQMPECEKSGYGIFMLDEKALKDEKTSKYVFYPFDAAGNELAKKIVSATKKADHIYIKVKGNLDATKGVIAVSYIEETEEPKK